MTSHKYVVALLLFIGVLSAFNVSDYLYPEEGNASVSFTNFTLNGTAYSIVSIDGEQTFVLKSGEPMTNETRMASVLRSYFIRTYYPTDDELDDLRELIQKFNDSRNDGYDFKGKEEYICRDDVLLSNGKITVSGQKVRCTDNETCAKNAMLLFSVYGEGLGLGSPTVIFEPLYAFTPTSLRLDELLGNYTERLDSLDEDSLVETISYIEDTSGELEGLADKIEATIFRTPRLNDSNDRKECQFKCWAICPSFDLDQDAAEDIQSAASDLSDKIAPLSGYQDASSQLYSRTTTRMQHVKGENMAVYYADLFAPINESGEEAIALGDEAVLHVLNRTLAAKLDSLKSLHATIPEDIENRSFSSIEQDLSNYESLAGEVSTGAAAIITVFNATSEAKNEANSLILVLQSKDLDPISMRSLELLENRSEDLDAQFRDGLTLSELEALGGNYSEIAEDAKDLLQSESETPTTRVLLLFRGFARRINTGIAHVADTTDIVERSEIPEGPLHLGAFSLVVFLSFSSIALLLFLYIFAISKFTIPKTAHILGAAFLSMVMLILVFSVLMYMFLGKTSTDATLPEFLADFSSRNDTVILVDLREASYSDANAMRSCAMQLADSFSEQNKSWKLYTLSSTACSSYDSSGANSTLGFSDCEEGAEASPSSFLLAYSDRNEAPRFSIIYENRAEIHANLDYYDSCPLVALFS